MKQNNQNEKINRDAEKKEIDRLRGQIECRLNKCPPLINGSHQTAVAWKQSAGDAMRAAASKAPTLKKMQEAFAKLDAFYPSDFALEAA